METSRFHDRAQAGRTLARMLSTYAKRSDVLVLALPRGGVPVACAVARRLGAPLDTLLVRKLGVPWQPELAMGAIASGGLHHLDHGLINTYGIEEEEIEVVIARESRRLAEQEALYRQPGRQPPVIRDRTVILVDDGIATGASMLAAVRAVRIGRPDSAPRSIIVAVPVGPQSACRELAREADDVVCATMPPSFDAVGQAYFDFHQVSDDEVRELLATPTHG